MMIHNSSVKLNLLQRYIEKDFLGFESIQKEV